MEMEKVLTYNQAVFGLMLMGAKADGKLQEEEKRLLVELTSEEHHLSAEEYKMVINEAKGREDLQFESLVFQTLNNHSSSERIKALYWLLRVIQSDTSSNNSLDQAHNESEMSIYQRALRSLKVKPEDVESYESSR